MKFGKYIQTQQAEWAVGSAAFLNYKGLKKIINSIDIPPSASSTANANSNAAAVTAVTATGGHDVLLQPYKTAFFFKLERELEKINSFYLQKEAEFKIRLRSLLDYKKRFLVTTTSNSTTTASSSTTAATTTTTSFVIPKNKRSSLINLKEALTQFQLDLTKLQNYVQVNATGFRKILKKWDKRSKSSTKELYLSRQIEIQPCFNRDILTELTDAGTTYLAEVDLLLERDQEQQTDVQTSSSSSSSEYKSSALNFTSTGGTVGGHMFMIKDSTTGRTIWVNGMDVLYDLENNLMRMIASGDVVGVNRVLDMTTAVSPPSNSHPASTAATTTSTSTASLSTSSSAATISSLTTTATSGGGGPTLTTPLAVSLATDKDILSRVFLRSCADGSNECLALLLAYSGGGGCGVGVDLSFTDDISDRTSLHEAAIAGRLDVLKLCVNSTTTATTTSSFSSSSQQQFVLTADVYGRIPLHYSAMYGHTDCCMFLLNECYKPIQTHGSASTRTPTTPLATDRDDDFNIIDHDGCTPLIYAIMGGHEPCARLFIEAGAVRGGDTMVSPKSASSPIPLCLACQYGLLSTATLLLEKGAAWQANSDGLFPLHLAAREGHAAIAQLLINSSSGSITSSSSSSASLATSTSSSLMNADIVECKDVFNGWTPLFFAASEGRLDVVKVLLSAGARVNVLDEHGWLPWTYALYKGYIQVAELLVVKDVDFSSNGGDNSLHSSSAPPLVSSPSLPCGGSPATLARQQATLNGGQLFGEGEAQSPMKLGASVLPISSPTSSRSASLKPMAPSSFFHQTGSHVAATVDKAVLDTLDSIDDIPTLSLPPPIIPFRIYGHNYLDNKCYIQISFDVYHKESSQPPASSHIPPAAASSLNSTPFLSKSSAAATAPPQTPLGAYHHGSFLKPSVNQQVRKSAAASAAGSDQYPNSNYYQGQPPSISSDGSKSVVPAITLFGSKQLSSFKLVISSKPEVGIPYSVILPIENDSDAGGEVFTFLVDQQDVAGFMVQFDIFPAFGTKVIGRAVLSPDMIAQSLATSSSSSLSAADLHDQSGRQCCPLVDHHLRVVGQISFQCTVVQPFKHPCLSIGGKVDTYWKSTFTKFVSAPHSSTIGVQQTTSSLVTTALTTSSATTSTTTTTTTTQGLITTHSSSATGASSGVSAAVSATNVHSGIQSYITASSLMEEYIVVPVQVTGDGVAVIYGQWWVDIKLVHHEDNAVGVPLSSLTLAQLHSVTTSSMSSTAEAIQKCIQLPVIDVRKLSEVLKMSAMPLMDVLSLLPLSIGLCIEVAYPSASERQLQSSTNHLIISRSTPLPINSVVDSILTVVYDHGKLAADSNNGSGRNVIFSSLNPNICTTLNWKQPNYGVFFKTRVGFDDQKRMNDDRCNSIKAAIKFAKANNLLGLICEASPLVQVPPLINTIKESGLILASFGPANAESANVRLQHKFGVDAIVQNDLFKYIQAN